MPLSSGIVSKRDLSQATRKKVAADVAKPDSTNAPVKKGDTVGLGTFRSLTMDYSPGHPEEAPVTAQKSASMTAHDVLKKKPKRAGFQKMPMNTDAISASLTAANS